MFKFIRCKYKLYPEASDFHEGWFLHIDSKEALNLFLLKRSNKLVGSYMHLKENVSKDNPFRYKNGEHISEADESVIANLLTLDDTRKSVVDDCKHLDKLLLGYISVFQNEGHIIVNKNSGCRWMDSTFEILETKISEELVFPTTGKTDYIITQWPNGKHWYVRVGNFDLTDKFNTYESAKTAAEKWLEDN